MIPFCHAQRVEEFLTLLLKLLVELRVRDGPEHVLDYVVDTCFRRSDRENTGVTGKKVGVTEKIKEWQERAGSQE